MLVAYVLSTDYSVVKYTLDDLIAPNVRVVFLSIFRTIYHSLNSI